VVVIYCYYTTVIATLIDYVATA